MERRGKSLEITSRQSHLKRVSSIGMVVKREIVAVSLSSYDHTLFIRHRSECYYCTFVASLSMSDGFSQTSTRSSPLNVSHSTATTLVEYSWDVGGVDFKPFNSRTPLERGRGARAHHSANTCFCRGLLCVLFWLWRAALLGRGGGDLWGFLFPSHMFLRSFLPHRHFGRGCHANPTLKDALPPPKGRVKSLGNTQSKPGFPGE